MKASELRLGNLIYDIPERGGKIISVNKVWIDDDGESLYFDLCNPIPLTEEWLLKFGFEKKDSIFSKTLLFGILQKNGIFFCEIMEGGVNVKCVHQLQNLYFALTGEELEIKE